MSRIARNGCLVVRTLFAVILTVGVISCEVRSSKISGCVLDLRNIQVCKELWADNYSKTSNDIPTWDDLRFFFPVAWSNSIPVCPAGGSYKINRVGEQPTCSIGGPEHSSQYYTK